MTQLDFSEKLVLPSGGITILVRDDEIYRTWAHKETFWIMDDSCSGHIDKKIQIQSIKKSDKVYHFPENKDIFKSLSRSTCLDKYLLRMTGQKSRQEIGETIRKKLDEGAIIGVSSTCGSNVNKYHIKDKRGDPSVNLYEKSGKFNGGISDFDHENYTWYEFKSIYELGHWLYT